MWRLLSPAKALNEETIERCRQSLLEDEDRELQAWKGRRKEHWEFYFQGSIQNRLEILRKDSNDFESSKLDLQHRRSVSMHPEAHCFVARVDSRDEDGILCQVWWETRADLFINLSADRYPGRDLILFITRRFDSPLVYPSVRYGNLFSMIAVNYRIYLKTYICFVLVAGEWLGVGNHRARGASRPFLQSARCDGRCSNTQHEGSVTGTATADEVTGAFHRATIVTGGLCLLWLVWNIVPWWNTEPV